MTSTRSARTTSCPSCAVWIAGSGWDRARSRAADLRQITADDGAPGLMSYDPAFTATASCRSAITFIDGDRGILRYRGYPIDQLAERSSFLEVAYLLLNGELPTRPQL